jgi:hypothetical protein
VEDTPTIETQHDEGEQQTDRDRRDHREVDGDALVQVVPQKRPPALRR